MKQLIAVGVIGLVIGLATGRATASNNRFLAGKLAACTEMTVALNQVSTVTLKCVIENNDVIITATMGDETVKFALDGRRL